MVGVLALETHPRRILPLLDRRFGIPTTSPCDLLCPQPWHRGVCVRKQAFRVKFHACTREAYETRQPCGPPLRSAWTAFNRNVRSPAEAVEAGRNRLSSTENGEVIIYRAFAKRNSMCTRKPLTRRVHDQYFDPTVESSRPRRCGALKKKSRRVHEAHSRARTGEINPAFKATATWTHPRACNY